MLWWWGYTEPVSPRPPRLHRISTNIRDRVKPAVGPAYVRYSPIATEMVSR